MQICLFTEVSPGLSGACICLLWKVDLLSTKQITEPQLHTRVEFYDLECLGSFLPSSYLRTLLRTGISLLTQVRKLVHTIIRKWILEKHEDITCMSRACGKGFQVCKSKLMIQISSVTEEQKEVISTFWFVHCFEMTSWH